MPLSDAAVERIKSLLAAGRAVVVLSTDPTWGPVIADLRSVGAVVLFVGTPDDTAGALDMGADLFPGREIEVVTDQ